MRRFRTVVHLVLLALIAALLAVDTSPRPAAAVQPPKSPTAAVATPELQPAAGQFVPVPSATVVNAVAVAAGGTTTVTVTGANGVPAAGQVSSVAIQISAMGATTPGWVQSFAAGTTRPADSTNSFVTGRYTASYDVVPVSASGQISLYSSAASTVYVRLRGYYTSAATTTAGATFVPLPSTTVVNNVDLTTNGVHTQTIAGANGVPAVANVAAVALDVVASAATAAGYVRTYPAGAAAPADATVYYPLTVNQGNYETVKLSASGQVSFAVTGATHLIVRLRGYYLMPTASTAGSSYVPVARATVVNGTALAAGGTTPAVALAGANGVPAAAAVSAVAVNVNASAPTAAGSITGYPTGATRPSDASLYYGNGLSTASHDTLGFSSAGQTTFYASGATKLFVRLRGYFLKATAPAAPTAVTATGADQSATVAWATPKDGGAAITGYTVTANPGAIKMTVGAVNTATIGGLTNGIPYTFTVQATNAVGTGPSSAASKAIVPMGSEVLYAHDLAGRVRAAFTSEGTGVEYVYDAVGNITATKSLPANVLKIVQTGNPEVAPGDEYEIYGTGFGLDPAQVSVSIGGVNAPVKTLRRNHLIVTIPSGTSGSAVTVTVGGTTIAAGSVGVLVTPQISSFGPLVVNRGATVTITGSNFAPSTPGNTVTVNAMKLQVLTASPTTLTVKAPTFGLAGKVVVRTKGGTATSTGHLAVVPAPFLAADVAGAPHTTVGTPATVNLTTSNQIALFTTDGTPGKRFGYKIDETITGCYEAHIWAPDRSAVYAEESLCGTQYIDLPRSATAGTYLLELDPRDPTTGGFTVTAQESTDVAAPLTIDGPEASTTTTQAGSHPLFTFTGTKGQLVFTTLSAAVPSQVVDHAVLWGPSGQKLKETSFVGTSPNNYLPAVSLPETGTYTLDYDPARFDVGTFKARVTTVPAPITATTTIDGTPGRLTIAKPGQNGSVSFTGQQGQLVHIDFLTSTILNGRVSVRGPDGSFLYRDESWAVFLQYQADRYTLPQTGEYIVLLEPGGSTTGTIDVKVNTIPADAVYTTTVDGPAKAVANTVPGQSARLTFPVTEGQRVMVTCVRDSAHDSDIFYQLLDPAGQRVESVTCAEFDRGILFDTRVMTAGTWTVVVDPQASVVYGPTLRVVSVPADTVVNSALGSNPAVSLAPGQNATVTFPVAAGKRFFIGCTLPDPSQDFGITFELRRPDGTRERSTNCLAGNKGQLFDTTTSATAGTWTIVVDPTLNATAAATVRLIDVPADVVKPATVGGAGVAVATTTGQSGRITFTGAANQKIKGTITAQNYPNIGGRLLLLDAAGTTLTSTSLLTNNSLTYTLPTAATYTLLVDPIYADTGSATVTVATTTLAASPRAADAPDRRTVRPAADEPDEPEQPPVYPRRRDAALTGKILRTDGKPIAGVTVRVADRSVKTKRDGSFVLTRLPQGTFLFVMDGRTASTPTTKYGYFDVQVNLRKGTQKLFYQPYLPILDTANEVPITSPTTAPIVIKTPKVKGLELHLPKGVTITDADGKPVTRVGLTPIPVDRTPIPMPKGVQVPVYFTIQPAGGEIHGGEGQLYYPNYLNQKPGTEMNFWTHEKYAEGWEIYGHGNVTPDGSQVKPSYDTGIENFDGAMINVPGWLEALVKGVLEGLGSAGDPVDLGTGRFTYTQSDLSLGGFIPIEAQRAYSSGDGQATRPFGMGTMGTYDTFLTSKRQWEELDLNLIDGTQVHYVRTSPGRGYSDAAFAATGTFGQFAGSTVVWNGNGWDLRLRDGTTLVYGDLAPLQSIRDRFGHSVKIRRIAKNSWGSQIGAIVSVTSSEGYWLSYDYNTAGQITAIHDNAGRTVSYTYDTGLLKTVTDVNGGVTTYGWDASKRLTTITDAKNQLFLTNTYDANNRVIQQKQADGGLYKFDYVLDSSGKKVVKATVTDPAGAVRVTEFDSSGYLSKSTSAAGTTAESGYSVEREPSSHLPLKTSDSTGRSIVSIYNGDQQATSTTVSLGTSQQQSTATYNGPEGAMDSTTDALGNTSRYTFDAAGNVATSTDAEGRKTSYEWNSDGMLTKRTPEGAGPVSYEYLDDVVSAVTDAGGRRTSFNVDAAGRVQETVAPDGGVSSVQYDAANQVLSAKDALGVVTTYTYDKNGNRESLKDGRGGTSRWTYDAMDRVQQATDQVGESSTYTYNALGRPVTMTDRRGLTLELRYDDLQRNVFTGFGRTGTPGAYQYQSTLISLYDEKGRLKSLTDSTPGAGSVAYTYDDKDRPVTETTAQGTITREWDEADRLAKLKVPGLPDTTYTYDKTDLLTEVQRGTVKASYGYDSVGRLKTLNQPGGVVRTAAYDLSSMLTGLTYASGSEVLGDVTYHYDTGGRLDRTGGSWARADLPPPVASAVFDPANRLTALDGVSRHYDAEGNLTSDGTSTYTWNARGELTATTGAAGDSQLRYDALGRRIGTTIGADTWNLRYDGSELMVEDGPGSTDATYLAGSGTDSAVARIDGLAGTGGASSLLTDRQGSVLARTDPDASTLAAQYTYSPYGEARSSLPNDPNPVRYTGRESGAGTPAGLQFQRSRWYEPGTGRFLSEDPAGFGAAGPNLYSYVGGNPADLTDPSGAIPAIVAACVGDALVNTVAGALLGRKHTAGDYLRGLAKGCADGVLMFGVGKFLSIGLRSAKPAAKLLDDVAERVGKACRVGPRSFTGDTLVQMADGSAKPISEIKVGDEVLAADPRTGEQGPHRVSAIFEHPDEVTDLDVDGHVVTTTEDHPFWNATDQRFEEAQELDRGDQLQSPDGSRPTVGGLRAGTSRTAQAYNLTVDGVHTYFVFAGAEAVLVHNVGECSIDGIPHGELGEFATHQLLQDSGYSNITKEVYFTNSNGDLFRADFVAQNPAGEWVAFEVKTNSGGLTPNQALGYLDLGSGNGAVVRGNRLPGIAKGTLVKMKVAVELWTCGLCS
ncbi:polymorphic toxin-type HINT domain-containing protein [Kribbella sp. NPDC051587]|uniref:polymorphic toxin-type HINT domain-containing protein n=1 Tax=Kribbella sp. NPDC051587 TaxID=3364119 RepID=UPI003791FC08